MTLLEERTIALAGIIQACQQVQMLARKGEMDREASEACLNSILILDAVNTPAVYGGLDGVRLGLVTLKDGLLNSSEADNVELLRYMMSIMHLQTQLYRDHEKFTQFGEAVERLSSFPKEELVEACSEVYQTHVSVMRPQVIVQGEEGYLQREDVPPQIRALLLAAVRSAVLWQQKEGSRFKILWQRTRMQNAASALLKQLLIH